jgi:hypothetical protein
LEGNQMPGRRAELRAADGNLAKHSETEGNNLSALRREAFFRG